MKTNEKLTTLTSVLMLAIFISQTVYAEKHDNARNNYVPTTISSVAQRTLADLYKQKIYDWKSPSSKDLDGWRKTYDAIELDQKKPNSQAVIANHVTINATKLGGVPVLDIRPKDWQDNHKILVYLHGGGYTIFSARSTLITSAPICRATGLRVISVDYTTAPVADWQKIQAQVISVMKALVKNGYAMSDIAFYGDSAGGGLAVNTVLNLRHSGMGMPAAVVLLSPWVDLTNNGDTTHTLDSTDPTLKYEGMLENSALAYAQGTKLTNPHVSPLYADFTKGFSPTLITEGTKCIFLSSSVRLYQALEAANQDVKLDMYEGMWHVFQQNSMPESNEAVNKAAVFIKKHLEMN